MHDTPTENGDDAPSSWARSSDPLLLVDQLIAAPSGTAGDRELLVVAVAICRALLPMLPDGHPAPPTLVALAEAALEGSVAPDSAAIGAAMSVCDRYEDPYVIVPQCLTTAIAHAAGDLGSALLRYSHRCLLGFRARVRCTIDSARAAALLGARIRLGHRPHDERREAAKLASRALADLVRAHAKEPSS
jgi:hypothetical protein